MRQEPDALPKSADPQKPIDALLHLSGGSSPLSGTTLYPTSSEEGSRFFYAHREDHEEDGPVLPPLDEHLFLLLLHQTFGAARAAQWIQMRNCLDRPVVLLPEGEDEEECRRELLKEIKQLRWRIGLLSLFTLPLVAALGAIPGPGGIPVALLTEGAITERWLRLGLMKGMVKNGEMSFEYASQTEIDVLLERNSVALQSFSELSNDSSSYRERTGEAIGHFVQKFAGRLIEGNSWRDLRREIHRRNLDLFRRYRQEVSARVKEVKTALLNLLKIP